VYLTKPWSAGKIQLTISLNISCLRHVELFDFVPYRSAVLDGLISMKTLDTALTTELQRFSTHSKSLTHHAYRSSFAIRVSKRTRGRVSGDPIHACPYMRSNSPRGARNFTSNLLCRSQNMTS
jgi:hypothetical protein